MKRTLLTWLGVKESEKKAPTTTAPDEPESYSWKEAKAMGAFSEHALSREDAQPLTPGLETSFFEEDSPDEQTTRPR